MIRRFTPGQWGLTVLALLAAMLFLVLPLAALLTEALRHGLAPAFEGLTDPEAVASMQLTALMVAICVPVNTVCGVLAAYCLTKFRFPGRGFLMVLVELPLTVSPVVSGLVWVLLFGARGWFGPYLDAHRIEIIFAVPGMALATLFVTFPFVARTVMPLMETQGRDAEEAAAMLGAGFFTSFWRVTLPDVGWALLSGILLTTARAMGEFGAVSVVSGHVAGQTETIPLHIETLYNDYQTAAAFSLASLLAIFSLATVGLRSGLEWRRGILAARA